jgi:hypothetical protein
MNSLVLLYPAVNICCSGHTKYIQIQIEKCQQKENSYFFKFFHEFISDLIILLSSFLLQNSEGGGDGDESSPDPLCGPVNGILGQDEASQISGRALE